MDFSAFMAICVPAAWFLAPIGVFIWIRVRARANRKRTPSQRKRISAYSTAGLAAAFQFLSLAYRPNHAFMAKAQIQQQEDADEEDDGSPETPLKHLHRQLRRIRRGEEVDRIIWRLE